MTGVSAGTALTERFKTLVRIDNPSGEEATIRDWIGQALTEMGVRDQQVDDAGNLLVRVPGDSALETILLCAHMDSVPPCCGIEPVEDTRDGRAIIRSAGKTVLGADDNAGIAAILEVVSRCMQPENAGKHHPLELLFTTREEIGLLGAKGFDMAQLKAAYSYVLDGEGQVGEIFHAGASQEGLLFTCTGKRAHSGLAPEEGISAIEMAAELCAGLPIGDGGRISDTMTTNLGVIDGGVAMNVVAPEATVRGELRGHAEEDLLAQLAAFDRVCREVEGKFPGSAVLFDHQRRYNAFVVPVEHPVVVRAVEACKMLGLTAAVKPMNIGSDAHVLNHGGLPTVVLGMGFHYSHSLGEFIDVDEFEQVADWVCRLVRCGRFAEEA